MFKQNSHTIPDDREAWVQPEQGSSWVLVAFLFVGLPLLLDGRLLHHPAVARPLAWVGTQVLPRLCQPEPLDQDAVDLADAVRREELAAHLARLRRLIATDEHMSATRQIGNRIAYEQVRQLAHDFECSRPDPYGLAMAGEGGLGLACRRVLPPRPDRRPDSVVETIDLGWRR